MSKFSSWGVLRLPTAEDADKISREDDDDDQYLTESVIEFLREEGFEHQDYNDSYCFDLSDNCRASDSCCNETRGCNCCGHTYDEMLSHCWKKKVGLDGGGKSLSVYVTSSGIGIDRDHSNGDTCHTYTYKFEDYDSFVETYNKMVLRIFKLLSK